MTLTVFLLKWGTVVRANSGMDKDLAELLETVKQEGVRQGYDGAIRSPRGEGG